MTTIQKIKFHGFKSFAKPIEIEFGNNFNVLIGPNGSGKCLLHNSRVILSDGSTEKIGDLVNQKLKTNKTKKVDDGFLIRGNDKKILSLNLKNNKIEEKPILMYVKRKAPKKLIRIKTKSGKEIISTKYHPLFILKDNNIISAKADELKEGTRIATPRRLNIKVKNKYFYELLDLIGENDQIYVPFKKEFLDLAYQIKGNKTWKEVTKEIGVPLNSINGLVDKQAINFSHLVKILRFAKLDNEGIASIIQKIKAKSQNKVYNIIWKNSKEFSRFLGYLLAEGRLTSSNQIWFTNGTEEVVQDYISLIKKLFNIDVKANEYKPNCWDVLVYSSPLIKVLTKVGMPLGTAKDKDITNVFLTHSTNEELSELLNGYYCGDGYVSKNSIEVTTKSSKLAFKISTILLRLGIISYLKLQIKIATNSNFSGLYHTLVITNNESIKNFYKNIGLIHKRKQKRLNKLALKKANSNDDLIETNLLIRNVTRELNIKLKKIRKKYPRLESYCYNQATPSREGLNYILKEVLIPEANKQGKIQLIKGLQLVADSDIFWDKITEIEELEREKWVYDLCVDENHNFIANNVIVHNSNVVDGLTFVLGKRSAKAMRAEKASNLIFNGGKKGTPMKEASVSIYFTNNSKDFPIASEIVKITRIVKQSGQSDYRINDEKRTREQIIDLLSKAGIDPDGFNILLQGDVVSFTEMRSDERRQIIEDVAGISVYEDKKQKALLELEKVDQKINEANLILKERDAHLRNLKKERDQALKFKELEQNIKENKATYLYLQIKEKSEKKEEITSRIKKHQQNIGSLSKEVQELRTKIDQKRSEVDSINKNIEEKSEIEQVSLQQNIEKIREEILRDETRLENLKIEIQKVNQRSSQLKKDEQEIETKIVELNKEKANLEEKQKTLKKEEEAVRRNIQNYKKKHNIQDFSLIEKIETEIEQLQNSIISLKEQKSSLIIEQDRNNQEVTKVKELLDKFSSPQVKKKREELEKVEKELDNLINNLNVTITQIDSNKEKLEQFKQQLSSLRGKKISITDSFSGNQSVNLILNSKINGVFGTIASLGKVNEKYSTALEVTAGARTNSVLVDNDTTAQKCIQILKDKKSGIATFLPLNKIRERIQLNELNQLKNLSGVKDIALNLIEYDKKFHNAFSYVFGSTLVVDDIPTARKVGIGRVRMVTLEGDLVEPSGAMIGGYRRKISGVFEQKDINSEITKKESEIEIILRKIQKFNNKKLSQEKISNELRNKKYSLEAELIKAQKTSDIGNLNELKKSFSNLNNNIKESNLKIKQITQEIEKNERGLDKLRSERQKLQVKPDSKDSLSSLENIEKELQDRISLISRIQTEIKNIENQILSIHNPEKLKIQEIIKQHQKELQDFQNEINQIEQKLKSSHPNLKEQEKKEVQFREDYKNQFIKRNKLTEDIRNVESKISQHDFKIKEIERRLNEVSLDNAKISAEIEALDSEFEEFKGTKIRRNISFADLKLEIGEFERTLKSLGNVNLRALEVYDTIEKEYREIVDKTSGLQTEKEDVLSMMAEIEGKKKHLFLKTYRQIAENFKRIFSSLSAKGEAYLDLEDKENPLQAGLDIKVKLAGTKFLDITSLSGGEKTLTALALIFAIQEHKPASFYLLDEVDAALDKTNSQLLAKLVANYAKQSQCIMISHNDSVITEADQVYGITMQQNGISKIVSMKL